MLLWRCDLCEDNYEQPIYRALIWSKGIYKRERKQGRLHATKQHQMPDAKCDVCPGCVERLADKMHHRGDPGNVGGCAPKCCICERDAHAIIRLIPNGKESWHAYLYTGSFCWRHLKPFTARARGTRRYSIRRQEVVEVKRLAQVAGD